MDNERKSGLKTVDKPSKSAAGSKPAVNGRKAITEPTITISFGRLCNLQKGRSFRNSVWFQQNQSKVQASLERLGSTGPLVDHLTAMAGSLDDGSLDPASLLAFCRDILAPMAEEQTGSRRFRYHVPAEKLHEMFPDGFTLLYDEEGTVQQPKTREAVDGITFG